MHNVERHHQIHRGFATLHLAMVFAGLTFRDNPPIDLNIILLAVLFLMIRAKFWFDDEAYLEDVASGKHPGGLAFSFGMLLAFLSWIAWCFAGLYIKDIETSSLIFVLIFALSTFWIIAAIVMRGAYPEQITWLFFNCLYGLGFLLIYWRGRQWNPFHAQQSTFTTCVLVLLLALFIADLGITRILELKRRPPT
jgi:hypothetical protein